MTVFPSGNVTVSITGLRSKTTGTLLPNKELEVYYGVLFRQTIATDSLGFVTTDSQANYKGPIRSRAGQQFRFDRGSLHQGNFYLNDWDVPGTAFVTGFAVAD